MDGTAAPPHRRIHLPGFHFGARQVEGQEGGFAVGEHFDVHRDVVLRLEFMSSREVAWSTAMNVVFTTLIIWSTVVLTVVQFRTSGGASGWNHHNYFLSTVIVGSVLLALLLAMAGVSMHRLWRARQLALTWSPRRKRLATLAIALVIVELLNLIFWVASSGYQAADRCHWLAKFSTVVGFVQWSLLNVALLLIVCGAHDMCMYRGPDKLHKPSPAVLVMDVGWGVHLSKLILWGFNEAIISVTYWHLNKRVVKTASSGNMAIKCNFNSGYCHMSPVGLTTFITMGVCILLYLLLYILCLWRVRGDLRTRSYSEMRMARTLWYLQTRQTLSVFLTLAITIFVLMMPKLGSCWNYILIWMGAVPMHAALTQTAVGLAFAFMAKNPDHEGQILQIWLQEFAWTEATKERRIQERNHHLVGSDELNSQPMFCMETAIKLLYWSHLIYDLDALDEGLATLETAMSLYGLHSHEVLWDEMSDTKAVIAWSNSTTLISFAGTSSMTNVLTDLKLKAIVHPPKRRTPGRRWGGFLRVHQGFHLAYTRNGYNVNMMERLDAIRAGSSAPESMRFLFTGHSLGGALATLAAHEFVQRHPGAPLTVYTYGSPRVGSRSWANEYASLVRDHFGIICDQDPVPRVPKGFSYKRVGERVACDLSGNLMIRPSPLETSMWNTQGGFVGDHLLSQYRAAMASIIKAQFGPAALKGGRAGAEELATALDLNAALVAVRCDLASLRNPSLKPMPQEVAARAGEKATCATCFSMFMCQPGAGTSDAMVGDDGHEVVTLRAGPVLPLANEGGTAVFLPVAGNGVTVVPMDKGADDDDDTPKHSPSQQALDEQPGADGRDGSVAQTSNTVKTLQP